MTNDSKLESDFLKSLMNNLPGMAYRCRNDESRTLEFVSEGAFELTEKPSAEFRTRSACYDSLINQEDLPAVLGQIKSALAAKRPYKLIYRIKGRKSEKWVWEQGRGIFSPDGELEALEGFITDFTENKQAEEMITYLAYYDVMTGLPNRLFFLERLTRAIDNAAAAGSHISIMLLNLNRFALINKSLGHLPGDHLIKMVAHRLEQHMGKSGGLARLSGDEFILLFPNVRDGNDAENIARRLYESVFKPSFMIERRELFVTAGIGISLYPDHGEDVETLIKNADTAMKRAKQSGRPCLIFSRDIEEKAAERLMLETGLRKALGNNELAVLYQPKVNLLNNRIAGMEALLRWRHPELGLVPPDKFIPLAEETGVIVPLGEWMLKESIKQNKLWQESDFPPVPIAVNISARQFQEERLLETVTTILDNVRLAPDFLELEITESCLMESPDTAIKILQRLKNVGMHISVDDFGTGYSSLNYLKRFPIDALKIDRCFIRDMAEDSDSAAIVKAVINLAHIMNLKVVAEGVETRAQLEFLREYDCDEIQGYLFSKPITAREFEEKWSLGKAF